MTLDKLLANILPFVIVVLISAFVGLTIVKIVDYRLSNISINMPSITLPQQQITIKMNDVEASLSKSSSAYSSVDVQNNIDQKGGNITEKQIFTDPLSYQPILQNKHESKNKQLCISTVAPNNGKFNSKLYKSDLKALLYEGETPEPTLDHLERPAPYPHDTVAMTEPDKSINGNTYYKDPKTMTQVQLIKFKNKAKFEHMNIIDYENWLGLFLDTPQLLTGFHRSNLRVIIRGGHLTQKDMPRVYPLPTKSDHEYTQMMAQGTLDNIPQPEYLGYKPSNFETQIGSSSKQNRSVKHLSFINTDEPLKTWILTQYKSPPSKTRI